MRIVLFWIDGDGERFPVVKIECCTDGSVRLVWVEVKGELRLRDVFKNAGRLDVYQPNNAICATAPHEP